MKVFIPAAGLGTRLKPLSDYHPKALVQYQGKPLIVYLLEKLESQGFCDLIINIHHFPDQMREFCTAYALAHPKMKIQLSDESNCLLDTGGALVHALPFFREEKFILVHNVDIISDLSIKALVSRFEPTQMDALLAVRERETRRKLLFEPTMSCLCAWVDTQNGAYKGKKPESTWNAYAFSGIHILKVDLIKEWQQFYGEELPFSIIDAYLKSSSHRRIKAYLQQQGLWKDMGKVEMFT
ncbi:MAG: sugar phosphate nucleotidyltransferase [Bacteroidales bacterium]